MTSRCAIYVDAGYLLASAATRVTGTSLRGGVIVDNGRLVEGLVRQAEEISGLPLLRVNWYDSGGRPGGQADTSQDAIGMLPQVKLRLGRLSPAGEQKGVDVRLGLDLATHGRNRVADVMFLVSGDDDLTEAVEEAQGHGVQVIVLAVPGADGRAYGVSRHLQREADGLALVEAATIDGAVRKPMPVPKATNGSAPVSPVGGPAPAEGPPALAPESAPQATETPSGALPSLPETSTRIPRAPTSRPPAPTPSVLAGPRHHVLPTPALGQSRSQLAYSTSSGDPVSANGGTTSEPDDRVADVIDDVCRKVLASWRLNATDEGRRNLRVRRPTIPVEIDRALLTDASAALGIYDLDDPTRYDLRRRFWEILDAG